jgi:hypothetical protein
METQFWTIKEANKAIPRVREKVLFLTALRERINEIVEQKDIFFCRVAAKNQKGRKYLEEHAKRFDQAVEEATELFYGVVEKLHQEGILVKDLDDGRVGFCGYLYNREILLCWTLKDKQVRWWHEVEEGYEGRQPISSIKSPQRLHLNSQ